MYLILCLLSYIGLYFYKFFQFKSTLFDVIALHVSLSCIIIIIYHYIDDHEPDSLQFNLIVDEILISPKLEIHN